MDLANSTTQNSSRNCKSNCIICRKCFENPKILPCSHAFCEECIREYIVSRGYDVFGFFPCPICQLGITIPLGGITQFYSQLNTLFPKPSETDANKTMYTTYKNNAMIEATISMLKDPQGLSCTKDNLIVVSDKHESKIMIFNLEHQLVSCFLCKEKIYSCTVSSNDTLLVTNLQQGQPLLLEFSLTGQRCGIKTTLNKIESTYGVTVLSEPTQYVVSVVDTSSLYILNETGKLIKKISGRALLGHPYYLCSDRSNDIIISDKLNHCIKILNRNGKLKASIGQMGTSRDCLFEPAGVCSDRNHNIIIADSGNRCVKIFSKCGKLIKVLTDFDECLGKPVNVVLTNDNEHIVILLNGCNPRFVIYNYDIPLSGKNLHCMT